jgi:hypothetical protein
MLSLGWLQCLDEKNGFKSHSQGPISPMAINKEAQQAVENYENGYCPLIECAFDGNYDKLPIVVCIKNECGFNSKTK